MLSVTNLVLETLAEFAGSYKNLGVSEMKSVLLDPRV